MQRSVYIMYTNTMSHQFRNFHLILKMQIGMMIKRNKIFNP